MQCGPDPWAFTGRDITEDTGLLKVCVRNTTFCSRCLCLEETLFSVYHVWQREAVSYWGVYTSVTHFSSNWLACLRHINLKRFWKSVLSHSSKQAAGSMCVCVCVVCLLAGFLHRQTTPALTLTLCQGLPVGADASHDRCETSSDPPIWLTLG